MKTGIVSLFCGICLILTSCSLPYTIPTHEMAGPDQRAGRLLSIRVERWDAVRFSGLLGLRVSTAGLYYVLLDATGVKLLEVEVAADGSHDLLRASGPLQNSDFAAFLSQALARIYLQEPDQMPCAGSWFYQICREESEDSGWRKYGQAGPFRVWQVSPSQAGQAGRTSPNSSGADAEAVVYRQPWLGVSISLRRAVSGR